MFILVLIFCTIIIRIFVVKDYLAPISSVPQGQITHSRFQFHIYQNIITL